MALTESERKIIERRVQVLRRQLDALADRLQQVSDGFGLAED